MKDIEMIFCFFLAVSPIIGFIPQIYTNNIVFPEILSLLTIIANILKLYHYSSLHISLYTMIPLQGIFSIILHTALIIFNKSVYSVTEEKIMKKMKLWNKGLYAGYIASLLMAIHLIGFICGTYVFCGLLSLVFEVSVNVIQLLIETRNKELIIVDETKKKVKQKSLYMVWLVGDIFRILIFLSAVTPWVYTFAAFIQLCIDGYLIAC